MKIIYRIEVWINKNYGSNENIAELKKAMIDVLQQDLEDREIPK